MCICVTTSSGCSDISTLAELGHCHNALPHIVRRTGAPKVVREYFIKFYRV